MPESPPGNPGADGPGKRVGPLGRSTLESVLHYLEARLDLAEVETKEAGSTIARKLVLLGIGCALLFFGYVILLAAAISLGSEALGIRWELLSFAVAAAHLALGIVLLLVARTRRPLFEHSLRELEKDRAWLQKSKEG
ncbi:MAG: phage holin family protein [Verrucomicrobiales bacterium]